MTTQDLLEHITKTSFKAVPKELEPLITAIQNQSHNTAGITAILLYGSGFWQDHEDASRVWDLYVLVDTLKDFSPHLGLRIAGSLIPPNVYYTDKPKPCKYAVMRLDQFEKAVSSRAWKPQIWARFAQPCHVVYVRDDQAKDRLSQALAQAVITFHEYALSFAEQTDDARSIWHAGLQQTYRSELRSEGPQRIDTLYDASKAEFETRTKLVLKLENLQMRSAFKTKAMRPLVKFLYFLQLMKASLSFQNAVEYALWKIERHSGQKFEATAFQKKYPLIAGWPLLWKIYRAGALR